MEIAYVYQKKRIDFGKHYEFHDTPVTPLLDIVPDTELQKEYVIRNPCDQGIQSAPEMSEHSTNTNTIAVKEQGMEHVEGGWPKDVDISEIESKNRYVKKMSNDEKYVRAMKQMSESMIMYLKQNIALDMFEEYFEDAITDYVEEQPSAKTLTALKDPSNTSIRSAVHISWFPVDGKKLAVAYCSLQFQQMPEGADIDSYIWDISNPNTPESRLSPTSPLCCIEYNPKENSTLVGGSYNGIISFFDIRKGPTPVEFSSIKISHRDPVYDIKWIQSKTHSQCVSCSTDGQLIVWDTRNLSQPLDVYVLDLSKGTLSDATSSVVNEYDKFIGIAGGECIDYDASYSHNKFLVGTEQGLVVSCTRRRKDRGLQLDRAYYGHHGPIYSVQRNPFFQKYFLTIGDWTAKIWMEDLTTPIMSTTYHDAYLTDGCWSPSRPGVFFTTKTDGSLDIWDLLLKQNQPIFSVNLSDEALQCINVYDGKYLAVGSADGTTSLLELSDGLSGFKGDEKQQFKEEKDQIFSMFEREKKRETILIENRKEMALLKQAKKQNVPKQDKKAAALYKIDENEFKDVTEKFFAEIK